LVCVDKKERQGATKSAYETCSTDLIRRSPLVNRLEHKHLYKYKIHRHHLTNRNYSKRSPSFPPLLSPATLIAEWRDCWQWGLGWQQGHRTLLDWSPRDEEKSEERSRRRKKRRVPYKSEDHLEDWAPSCTSYMKAIRKWWSRKG